MRIEEFLADGQSADVDCIHPDATLAETAQTLLRCQIGALIVIDADQKMVGIVSERDLIHVVANNCVNGALDPVSSVMTRSVITCEAKDEVAFVLHLMNKNAIRHMPVLDDGKLVNILSIRELTRAYEILQVEANTDPLTDLSNRRPFLKTLNTEFSRAQRMKHPLSVAMIDIDHFKRVNDTFGHDAGDRALRAVSDMLIFEFRSIDMIGRLGGEEFAIVFPETDLTGARIACERLRTVVEAADIIAEDNVINITVSIGIATLSPDMADGPAILRRADELLYQAKGDGRNRTVVEDNVVTLGAMKEA